MDIVKIIALGLIAAGALGLAYGGFTYTQAPMRLDWGRSDSPRTRIKQSIFRFGRAGLRSL